MLPSHNRGGVAVVGAAAALVLTLVWLSGWWTNRGSDALVVYCAHDAIFSEAILRDFEKETGIAVDVRFDTEATKSLGLLQLIERERHHPRCDVLWNNELLGTLAMAEQGLLEPYQGTGWKRMPKKFRDPAGQWVGFAARMRVWIVNPQEVVADEATITAVLDAEPSRAAFAQPLFGTTLTHYAALWHEWGPEKLQRWHTDLRQRGLREVRGNAVVKDLVAAGTCDLGATDTDDLFVALDAGANVEYAPVRINGKTIAIPNSVAIIRGTKHRKAAERLVDYLTSAETEVKLAWSASRQIPLGPLTTNEFPLVVARLHDLAAESIDLRPLLPARQACLEWLRQEVAP